MLVVFDAEADGLLDEATCIWCMVIYYDKKFYKFSPDNIREGVKMLHSLGKKGHVLTGHNIIDYDLPLFNKITGVNFDGIPVLDTLVVSRTLNPERPGRHSLNAWGERVGVKKPTHEDWSKYSKEMLHRCEQDVKINCKIIPVLAKEAEMRLEELAEIAKEYQS